MMNRMKRYCVKMLRCKDNKFYVVYLSADCVSCAYHKAKEFMYNAYGIGTYYLISVIEE